MKTLLKSSSKEAKIIHQYQNYNLQHKLIRQNFKHYCVLEFYIFGLLFNKFIILVSLILFALIIAFLTEITTISNLKEKILILKNAQIQTK